MTRAIITDCRATEARGVPLSPEQLEALRLVDLIHEALENGHDLPAMRPGWCVVENTGGAAVDWVDDVAGEMGELGYEVLPCPVSAWAVGASHPRGRVLLVGWSDAYGNGEPALAKHAEVAEAPRFRADSSEERLDPWVFRRRHESTRNETARPEDWGAFSWGFEPDLVRAVHGIPNRVDRVGALGDAVVPQCAEVVGWVIRELMGEKPQPSPVSTGEERKER
jgi:DNA (cytosine-5)-methyltransferase 1